MRKRIIYMLCSLVVLAPISPANANMATISLDKSSNLNASGESVGIKISNFPQRAGLYLMQCVEPLNGVRPTVCNTAVQLWISNLPGASFIPTANISMKLDSRFGTTDCVVAKCGVFVRFDHTAPGDFSQDQFIAISFEPNTQSLEKIQRTLKVGSSIRLPGVTDAGAKVDYRVLGASKSICKLNKRLLIGIKPGECLVSASAPGSLGDKDFSQKIKVKIKK